MTPSEDGAVGDQSKVHLNNLLTGVQNVDELAWFSFGRYRFKQTPFGISSALEVFQKKNEAIFGDIDSVEIIFDDIIIAAADEREHDEVMRKLLQRARQANVKFNSAGQVQLSRSGSMHPPG